MVHERPLTVDLDDRDVLAVARLELGIARDVDRRRAEAEPLGRGLEDRLGVVAQVAVGRAVDDDLDRRRSRR